VPELRSAWEHLFGMEQSRPRLASAGLHRRSRVVMAGSHIGLCVHVWLLQLVLRAVMSGTPRLREIRKAASRCR